MDKNRALFLDRDGVINIDHAYVYKPEDFQFVDGIIPLLKRFQDAGYLLIVVTNQSGIARGYYTEADFHALTQWMNAQLAQQDIVISDVFYCPHHATEGEGDYRVQCKCRKPQPGMLLNAQRKWNIDMAASAMVGDSWRDMEAGARAGVANLYFYSDVMPGSQRCGSSLNDSNVMLAKRLNHIQPGS